MDIQITQLGKFALVTMCIVGVSSYFLGLRKTHSPKKACLIGVLLSIAPPLAYAYLVVLALKNDIDKQEIAESK